MLFKTNAFTRIFLLSSFSLATWADIPQEITTLLANKQHPYVTPSNFDNRAAELEAFYKTTNNQLMWLGQENAQQKIQDVLNLLSNAAIYGLNPNDYNVALLKEKLPQLLTLSPESYSELAQYDTAISLSLLRFAQHVHYGRVNFTALNFPLKLRDKKILDLAGELRKHLDENRLVELPQDLEPKLRQYQQLKSALANYQTPTEETSKKGKKNKTADKSQNITKIQLAMERLRWLPDMSAPQSVIVNIPAFQLWAIDATAQDPKDSFVNLRVVVGKAQKNQTPIVMADMKYIELMPYWNVPSSILKKEILPKLAANPHYLAGQNMEVVHTKGGMRVRQRPGGRNALGRIKFAFPNKNSVYLHDTPSKSLFSRSRRDFSHGCVRVNQPSKLAEFVLSHEGWSTENINKALAASTHRFITLKNTIPVLFFYTTAFYESDDKLAFYSDIYGHDATLLNALANIKDVPDSALFMPEKLPEPVIEPENDVEPSEPLSIPTPAPDAPPPPSIPLPVLEPLSP